MIFPSERISDLEQIAQAKRERFIASQNRLLERAQDRLTVGNLLKGGLVSATVGLPALFFAGKFLMRGGLLSKVFKAAALMAIRAAIPLVKPLFNSILKQLAKKFS
jgi:hypothetical protein